MSRSVPQRTPTVLEHSCCEFAFAAFDGKVLEQLADGSSHNSFNTGNEIVPSTHGLLTTPAYQGGPNAKPVYALEGSIAVAGSSVKWLRDQLSLIDDSAEVGKLASQVKDTGGVYVVPAFSGLFAPYWDDSASGCIIGLTGYTTKQHLCRATLEATCFQTKAILDAMAKDSKKELAVLR